jgi:hypothetical protein
MLFLDLDLFYSSDKTNEKEIQIKYVLSKNSSCLYTYMILTVNGKEFTCFTDPRYSSGWETLN